ncbi:hypothetical protein [Candidatus Leptofilum sp.]|uniref:hypothetical protein n=1 Tax=Candidatus Leptofilum sp. TaxID=3241576 RepID=UPI003B590136
MKNFTYRTCHFNEMEAVTDLFFASREELCLPDRTAAEKITNLIFTKGQVTGGFFENKLLGALGYFLGEPKRDFKNREVLYLYVGAILPGYRLTRLFHHGLLFTLQRYQGTDVTHLRLQAEKANPYTNKLYGRFAQPIAEEKSPRGVPVITYGGSIEDAIAYLSRGKRPKPKPQTPQQYYVEHRIRPCVQPHNLSLLISN